MILKAPNFIKGTVENSLMESVHTLLPNDPSLLRSARFWSADAPPAPRFRFQDGILYHKEHIYILKWQSRLQVLKLYHDAFLAGHFGYLKTWSLITNQGVPDGQACTPQLELHKILWLLCPDQVLPLTTAQPSPTHAHSTSTIGYHFHWLYCGARPLDMIPAPTTKPDYLWPSLLSVLHVH